MTIYIEIFLIQNILINYCLLRLIYLTTKTKSTFFSLLIASVFGAISSIISSLILTNYNLINLLKFITAIIMIIFAFKSTKKQFIFNFILLFIYTYALGGIITSLSSTSYQTSFGIITTSKFNLNLITIFTIIITYIYELVVKNLSYKIKTNNYIFSIKLFQGKNSISINAFLDTGNLLTYSNKPVVILDLKTYLKLTKTNLIEFFLNSKESTNLKTVSGENNLKIFKIDKMEIKEKRKQIIHENLFVAVNTTSAFKETNYKALLSPLFM